jgi:hypothetical protein
MDVASLAELLHETAEHHGAFEARAEARLVGLVRALHRCPPARQHARSGIARRRPLYG